MVQCQQSAEQVPGPCSRCQRQPCLDMPVDQAIEDTDRLPLGPLPRHPVGPACGPIHLGIACDRRVVHRPFGSARVFVDFTGEHHAHNDIHRQRRERALDRPTRIAGTPLRECLCRRAGDGGDEGLDGLRGKVRLQGMPLGTPWFVFGNQDAMSVQLGEHLDTAFPADQRIVMADQQFAHELRVGNDDQMFRPHAQMDQFTMGLPPFGQCA